MLNRLILSFCRICIAEISYNYPKISLGGLFIMKKLVVCLCMLAILTGVCSADEGKLKNIAQDRETSCPERHSRPVPR